MKKKIIVCFLVMFFMQNLQAQYSWRTGEKFTYGVKWGFLRLGTVSVSVIDSAGIDSSMTHQIKLTIDSNPLIFFVDMHSIFECSLDDQFWPIIYKITDIVDDENKTASYYFNYPDSFYTIDFDFEREEGKPSRLKFPLKQNIYEGLSLIYYSRANIHLKKSENIKVFWEDYQGFVTLNYGGESDSVKIDALDKKLPSYYVDGIIHVKGIAGLSGPFKSWFARDSQRPPLKASLKVFVGNVSVELEEWEEWGNH